MCEILIVYAVVILSLDFQAETHKNVRFSLYMPWCELLLGIHGIIFVSRGCRISCAKIRSLEQGYHSNDRSKFQDFRAVKYQNTITFVLSFTVF